MKNNRGKKSPVLGAALFFITIAVAVSVAVVIYNVVSTHTQSNTVIAVSMLAVIVVLSGICTLIDVVRRRVMVERPVEKILQATQKIASGDFTVRLKITHPYGRYDEFDYIMDDINKMAAELAKTEVLNSDFISDISHELKTPVAVIQSYALLMQKDGSDSEKRQEYAHTIVCACQKLTALAGNVLKLNKLENQQLTPECEVIRLDEALTESALQFEDILEQKGINLECDINEVQVYSSRDYLDIVWNNLISNAVKFTGSGGTVKITVAKEHGKAAVTVADTGCGISAETGAHIFDKFYQGDTSHSKESNGLGLALVKKVIDVIGGEISVESELGKGSAFTVKLNAYEER